MVTIEIETANAAFDGDLYGEELAAMLHELADSLNGYRKGSHITLRFSDSNGNKVGVIKHVPDAPEPDDEDR